MRRLAPLLTAICLCGSTALAQAGRPAKCSFSAPPPDRPAPVPLGWSDLEHDRLPPGVSREVRVHTGVAIAVPDYSLRLSDLGERITGTILVHWPGVDYERVGGDPGCQEWHEAERRALSQQVAQSHREKIRLQQRDGCSSSRRMHNHLRRRARLGSHAATGRVLGCLEPRFTFPPPGAG